MKRELWYALILTLMLATSGLAQEPPPKYVAQAKADLIAAGKDLSGACGAFRIIALVAWRTQPRFGFLIKQGGNRAIVREDGTCVNGDNPGPGYATDYLIDPNTGWGYDLLGDGGGANTPFELHEAVPEKDADMVHRNLNNFERPFAWAGVTDLGGGPGGGDYPRGTGTENDPIIAMPLANLAQQVRASARCYGRNDDAYWIEHADHPGRFSNLLYYVGWNAYWFERMAPNDTGSADPFLASKPAKQCGVDTEPVSDPTPVPTPVDLTPLLHRLDAIEAFDAIVVEKYNELILALTAVQQAVAQIDAEVHNLQTRTEVLESRTIPVSCTAKANLGGFSIPLSCKLQ